MKAQLSLLYVTFPSEEEAIQIAYELLEKKLIACMNILGPMRSVFRWKENIHTSEEIAALLKTTKEKAPEAIAAIEKLHSYETPAIVEIPADKVPIIYGKWVQESVR